MAWTKIRKGRTLARAATFCGIVAATTGLLVTTASADTTCAYFLTSQPDWSAANNTSWGSWPLGSAWGPSSIYIRFQSDGNLVVYRQSDNAVMWASGTYGIGVTDLDWSSAAGGILLKNAKGSVICQVGSGASTGHAEVQNDGNFVFYNDIGEATWSIWGTPNPAPYTRNYCGIDGH
jgi:hypothetical protein